ncbi:MAG: DUF4340 domain-containing protein [Deltaproteobacteria bacterium]|nr:DUF4340 domain-containing protein [Deltaproteobacteria bacterium]
MNRAWKRHGVTAALVVAAALLSVVALWDRGRVSTDESTGRKLQIFDAWRTDDITRLTLEGGPRRIELTQHTEQSGERTWKLREGDRDLSVDEQEVDGFLTTLEYASFERQAPALDRKALGLEPPHLVLSIEMGKLRYVLRVGGEAPSPPGARYAEVEGGARPKTLYVLKPSVVTALETEPSELRSKQLSPYVSSDVARYELVGGHGDFTLSRAGSGGRATVDLLVDSQATGKQRASYRTVDAFTTALARLEASTFVEAPANAASTATLTVVPRDRGKPKAVLALGGECAGGKLVRRLEPEPTTACVDARLVDAVLVEPVRFTDTFLLGVPETDVTEIKLTSDTTTVELARRGEGWHLRKPEDSQIDAAVGNGLLERLARAEGERVADGLLRDDKKLGLAEPRARVRILGLPDRAAGPDAPEHVEELEVGTEAEGFVHVRRKTDGAVLRVPEAVSAVLLPAPSALRSTQLLDVPMKHVRALALDCGGKHQAHTRDTKGSWTRLAPETALRADMTAANELAEALRTLAAVRWDAEKAEARHGLERPGCILKLTVAEPDAQGTTSPEDPKEARRTLELRLGAETDGGYFARLDRSPAVFVVPRALANLGREWLLDRGALLVEPAEVDRVTVTVGKKKLDVTRRGESWVLPSGAAPNDTRATTVGKALEALLAEGVATLGKPAKEAGLDEPRARIRITRRDGLEPLELVIGKAVEWHDVKAAYVQKRGVDATFVVSLARLSPLLDAP